MQLNLFEDNQTILLNCVDDCFRQLDFAQAHYLLEQVEQEHPLEPTLPLLNQLAREWETRLADPSLDWRTPEKLQDVWIQAGTVQHEPLKTALQSAVIDSLAALESPYRIFLAPDFHIGKLMFECQRFKEAFPYLEAALQITDIPAGLRLSWYGNALIQTKKAEQALPWLLTACLLDPFHTLAVNPAGDTMALLQTSLYYDYEHDLEPLEALAWLPSWAVVKGMVHLPLPDDSPLLLAIAGSTLEDAAADTSLSVPRRWFFFVLLAEQQRAAAWSTISTRRAMKQLNPAMFNHYLDYLEGAA